MKTVSLAGVSYLVRWRKIFTATRGKGWSNLVLMIKLFFTVAVSNAKLERMFPELKRVKTNFRCPLGVKRFENNLIIMKGVAIGKLLTQFQQ